METEPLVPPGAMRQAAARFVAWMIFGPLFFESIVRTVAWWKDPAQVTGLERLWVWAFPLLLFVFFRYFSKLRCGATCVSR